MRKITSFAIGAVALAGVAAAEVEVGAYAGYHSDYIFRGQDFGEGLVDFGLDVAGSCDCGIDWYAGVWQASVSDAGGTEEFDVFAGVSKDLGFGTVDLGGIVYSYPGTGDDRDAEVYLGLSTGYAGLELGLTTSVGLDGGVEDTVWVEGSIGYGLEVSNYALALEIVAGYNDDVEELAYYGANLSTDIAISDDITLTPYVSYVQTHEDLANGKDGFYGGASVSFAF